MATGSTIFALSSAPGRAGIAVIRVSGPAARQVLMQVASPLPRERQAAFRTIRNPQSGAPIDRAVVIFFAAPRSETGEDVAELQVHGGRAVVRATLDALLLVPGCRPAEAGEFARRAFDNGKLDLAEVEGLADLVDAETETQRVQALAQSSGALSRLYEGWRRQLIEAQALTEAAIDFADEGDVGAGALQLARRSIAGLIPEMQRHLADGHRGEILRDGFRVALLGPPNAGKSSLLNALARRDAAIVSEQPGTTRDVIDVRLDLGGYPVIVSDTAGLREAAGEVEAEGIRRSLGTARAAHLVLWLTEPGGPMPPETISRETDQAMVIVHTKADLGGPRQVQSGAALVSTKSGAGLDELVGRIGELAKDRLAEASSGDDAPPLTQARHRRLLERCLAALQGFEAGDSGDAELRAEELRLAAQALGGISGRIDVEDVLDQIFARFCIGK